MSNPLEPPDGEPIPSTFSMRNLTKKCRRLKYSNLLRPNYALFTDVPHMRQFVMSFPTQLEAEFWAWLLMTTLKAQGRNPWIAELVHLGENGVYDRRVRVLYNKSQPRKKMMARLREVHQYDI